MAIIASTSASEKGTWGEVRYFEWMTSTKISTRLQGEHQYLFSLVRSELFQHTCCQVPSIGMLQSSLRSSQAGFNTSLEQEKPLILLIGAP